jgi:hypothetical protein
MINYSRFRNGVIFGRSTKHLEYAVSVLDLGSIVHLMLSGLYDVFSIRFWEDLINLIPRNFSNLLFSNVYERSSGRLSSTFSGSSNLCDVLNLETRAQLIREFLNICKNSCCTKDGAAQIGELMSNLHLRRFNFVKFILRK